MSEKILRALMQLFAIVANADRLTDQGRQIVEASLKKQLSRDLVNKYLIVFDEYLESHKGKKDADKVRKRTSVNSVKVLKICTDINQELDQRQKYIVLLRLVEFVYSSDESISEQEWEFVSTVASIFNIPEGDFRDLGSLAGKISDIPDSGSFLKITGGTKHDETLKQTKVLYNDDLNGYILILYIKSIGTLLLKYFGDGELTLNGQPFGHDFVQVFTQGSVIRGNKIEPVYYSDVIHRFLQDTHQSRLVYAVRDITYHFKNGGIGLYPLSFTSGSGELIGIMGGSGAGKSTLLNLLNGNYTPTSGEVLINGINLHREKKKTEGIIGYIPQDDLLMEDLTVFQNVYYNTKLCYGELEEEAITNKVNELLDSLGLIEIKNLKVGNALNKTISGGQRKRLNIALELVREPAVLFVDEPTSGLSSRDSENVMDLLKQLAINGKLIFVVIHQPSSDIFKLFDKLLLLDTGGYTIYFGNPSDSLVYFKRMVDQVNADFSECTLCGNINPEQLFSIIEAKVLDEFGNAVNTRKIAPAGWNELYLKNKQEANSPIGENIEIENHVKKPSWYKQFKVFITRDILSKLSNTQYLLINLLEAPVLAFTLAFLIKYYQPGKEYIFRENQNITAFLFISVIVALFMGLTVSAEEIFRDRKILNRESFLNLSRSSYLLSKIAVMFLLSAVQTALFVIIGNSVLGIKGMYPDYWLMMFTTSCFANLLGLNISSAFNSAVTIYILIPILIIPQILLSGIIVKFEKLNPVIGTHTTVPFFGEVMTSRWAFEGLAVHQFKENKYEQLFFEDDKRMSKAVFQKDFLIPELIKRTDYSIFAMTQPEKKEMLPTNLLLLTNEILRENGENANLHFDKVALLNVSSFNASIGNDLKKHLNNLKSFYADEYNKAEAHKESVIAKYQEISGQEALLQLKDDYENESLSELLKNTTERKQIEETENRLIQRFQPVFMEGAKGSLIRAPFFSSRKNIFGEYYDTYAVNIFVIWFMSIFMYVALYFNWLKKGLSFAERISFKRKK